MPRVKPFPKRAGRPAKPKPPAEKTSPVKITESALQSSILLYLEAKGYFAWRAYTGPIIRAGAGGTRVFGKNPNKGFPDVCGLLKASPGVFFAMEIKRPKTGVVSTEQAQWGKKIWENHGAWAVVHSLEEVTEFLRSAGETL